jgi:hypothetical protein
VRDLTHARLDAPDRQQIAGWTFDHGYGYALLLNWASVAYLLGVGWVQLLLPRIEGVAPEPEAAPAVA